MLQERDCATDIAREKGRASEEEREWPAVSHQTFNEILLKTNTGTAQAAGGSRQQAATDDGSRPAYGVYNTCQLFEQSPKERGGRKGGQTKRNMRDRRRQQQVFLSVHQVSGRLPRLG